MDTLDQNVTSVADVALNPSVFCVFDTETTGLFNFKLPADDPSQPRLASVAFILADKDGRETARIKRYALPDGWEMPAEAGAINGLTTEFLLENGVPVSEILDLYETYVSQGLAVVAFNAQFDCKMMRSEFRRAGRDDLFEKTRNVCVMRALDPYGKEGLCIMRGYVNLSVACEHFGFKNYQAHDALADADAARQILERLIKDDRLPEPKVHLAKTKV